MNVYPPSRPVSQYLLLCTFLNFNLDYLSTSDNFGRLSAMLVEARYDEVKEKMQTVKQLYVSRHYSQCAKYGERLLQDVEGEIHPLHLAYINFYIALSHDTLAREATLKNRFNQLSLAETRYQSAIDALSPSRSTGNIDDALSPTSTDSPTDSIWSQRRSSQTSSFDSAFSRASSSTSYHQDTESHKDDTITSLSSFAFPRPPRSPTPTSTQDQPHHPTSVSIYTPETHRFTTNTSSFISMLQSHLSQVRALQEKASIPSPTSCFDVDVAQDSPTLPAYMYRHSFLQSKLAPSTERWQQRRTMTFRKRFDPESIHRLCDEALAEL